MIFIIHTLEYPSVGCLVPTVYLPSKYNTVPSFRLYGFRCLTTTAGNTAERGTQIINIPCDCHVLTMGVACDSHESVLC